MSKANVETSPTSKASVVERIVRFFTLSEKPPFSPETMRLIEENKILSDRLLRRHKETLISTKPRCKTCRFFDVLKDPAHPDVKNLCLCSEVLKMGMQPEPSEIFGCIFHRT